MQFTIASSASTSDIKNLNGADVVGIEMPSAWDAANLTFRGGESSASMRDLYHADGATEYTATAAASRYILIDQDKLRGVRFLQIRSGTAGVPVNQTAERLINVVLKTRH